ncbi:MAG: 16S rRNA (adenine(1518)-N(6)/adenine(1519)-N(6))-dimethyltransferase RsmA [Bacilli bacterium]
MEYSLKTLKDEMKTNNFNFKKMFGQNFIIDENITNRIVELADIDKNTLAIEIGPGAGVLTTKLCQKAGNVLCYEIDTSLKPILDKMLENYDNVNVLFKDFLKSDVQNDIESYNYDKLYVVANLPYYITTPIIIKLIEDNIMPDKIVVMVQKEVGNRFKAPVGTKDYNSLSIFLNYYFNVKKIIDISRNVFIPKPNVDSIVVEFSKKEKKLDLKNKELFFKLIRDSFKQKRKTLKNNLKEYDLEKVNEVLSKYNLDTSIRAEQVSIDIFVDIANNLDD